MAKHKNTYILGVSGGADSMCMLHKLQSENIVVAHLNHQLRKNADSDENFVKQYCLSNSIKFISKKIDVKNYAESNKISLETAGRILRYEFFAEIADQYENSIIMTAHNKNDSIESFFMHLLRGSSLSGLCGIHSKSKVKILDKYYYIERPLIEMRREEIEEYDKSNNVPFIIDETNNDVSFARNAFRHQIIPVLGDTSKIASAISRLQIDEDYLQSITNNLIEINAQNSEFSVEWFNKLHLALRRRIIHTLARKFTSFTISEERIDEAINAINKNIGKKIIQFPNGVRIEIQKGIVKIFQKD